MRVQVPIAKSESDRRLFPKPEVQILRGQAPIVKSESNSTPSQERQLLPKSQEKTSVARASASTLVSSPSNLPYRGRDTAETHEDKHIVPRPSPSLPKIQSSKTTSFSSIRDRRREPEEQSFKSDKSLKGEGKAQDDHKQRDISYPPGPPQDRKKPIRDLYYPLSEGFPFTGECGSYWIHTRILTTDRLLDFIPNDLPLAAQRDMERSMRQERSKADTPGYVYVYEICGKFKVAFMLQIFNYPLTEDPNGSPDTIQLKVGRSNNPVRRMKEWYRQCGLPQGERLFFETTWCHRLERLVHIEMRALEEMQLTRKGKSVYRASQKCPGCTFSILFIP